MTAPPRPPKPITEIPTKIPVTALRQPPGLKASQLAKGRVDFKVDEFDKKIAQFGYHLVWRKALLCPCVSPETDQARIDCSICDSSGYFYIEPISVQAIMSGLESRKGIYRNLGEWLEGMSVITTKAEIRLGYRDSLASVHSVMVFNEWITKGNRKGPRVNLPVGHDVARYRILRMLHMFYEVDERPVLLEERIDYEITEDGWIHWLPTGNQKVPDKTLLTIHYEYHPVWIVISAPHGVRDTVTKRREPAPSAKALPIQAAVKLDYLIDSKTTRMTSVTASFGND